MKKLFLGGFLLLGLSAIGLAATVNTLLPAAVNSNLVTITTTASGLGNNNISCVLQNNSPDEVKVQIPPGLHFKAGQEGAQDLLTVRQEFIVLKPNATETIQLTGYCMNASNFSPRPSTSYRFNGYAQPNLRTLSDSLALYEPIATGYAQMFVWSITNHREMYDIAVEKKYIRPATNIMNFVARVARVASVRVSSYDAASLKGKTLHAPSVNVFSKRAILAFHNPSDQVASFKLYDAEGQVKHVLFENRVVRHGLTEYTFGINDIVPPGATPVYQAKVISKTGKVLAQMKVDKNTEEVKISPLTNTFTFSFQLEKGVKGSKLNVYLEDGTLVENFKRYEYLPMGHYNLEVSLRHLHPAGTKFITKLEGENGVVYAQFPEAKK